MANADRTILSTGLSAGLAFDRNIVCSWDLKPSVGIVAKNVNTFANSIESFKEPLTRAVKGVAIPSIRTNFEVEGRPRWPNLSQGTLNRRTDSGHILVRSGTLETAATSFNIWSIGNTSATVRGLPANAWYGYVHQAGYSGEGKSFNVHMERAKKALGPRASGMEIVKLAFMIMDKVTGGEQGQGGAGINIPQRQFIMLQDEDIPAIGLVFDEWITEQLAASGWLGSAPVGAL